MSASAAIPCALTFDIEMRVIFPILLMVLVNCQSPLSTVSDFNPKGEFVASIIRTDGALTGSKKEINDGFVFHIDEGSDARGHTVLAYRIENREISEELILPPDTYNKLKEIGLKNFTFDVVVQHALARSQGENPEDGIIFLPLPEIDGWEYEIRIKSQDDLFSARVSNLNTVLDQLSPFSEELQKLKMYIHILSNAVGDSFLYSQVRNAR